MLPTKLDFRATCQSHCEHTAQKFVELAVRAPLQNRIDPANQSHRTLDLAYVTCLSEAKSFANFKKLEWMKFFAEQGTYLFVSTRSFATIKINACFSKCLEQITHLLIVKEDCVQQ